MKHSTAKVQSFFDMSNHVVRGPYQYDAEAVSRETGLMCLDPSLTVQADAEETDINVLLKRFGVTGEMPQRVEIPLQEDFLRTLTYHEALNEIRAAEEAFMEYPADIRARFNHDAGLMVAWASDPKNREEAEGMGLVIPESADKGLSAGTVTTRGGTVPAAKPAAEVKPETPPVDPAGGKKE